MAKKVKRKAGPEFYQIQSGVYKNEWRWRLWSKNGKIIAESGESYKRRAGAEKGLQSAYDGLWVHYRDELNANLMKALEKADTANTIIDFGGGS